MSRLKDKPFVYLGINSDEDREKLKLTIVKREKITWRSWWDGGSSQGPIARQWNVTGWPTTYIIDEFGTIRFKEISVASAGPLVDMLLSEMDQVRDPHP